MKNFVKNYLGKGKQVKNLDIVKVTVALDELVKIAHEFDGTKYVTFEIARMQNPDSYGRTHTVYHRAEEEQAAQPPKGRN